MSSEWKKIIGELAARHFLIEETGKRGMTLRGFNTSAEDKICVGKNAVVSIPDIPHKIDLADLHPNDLLWSNRHIRTAVAYTTRITKNDINSAAVKLNEYLHKLEIAENLPANDLGGQSQKLFFKTILHFLSDLTKRNDDGHCDTAIHWINTIHNRLLSIHDSPDVTPANQRESLEIILASACDDLSHTNEPLFTAAQNDSELSFLDIINRLQKLETDLNREDLLYTDKLYLIRSLYRIMGLSITISIDDQAPSISEDAIPSFLHEMIMHAAWRLDDILDRGRNTKKSLNRIQGFEGVEFSLVIQDSRKDIPAPLYALYRGKKHDKHLGSGSFGKAKLLQSLGPEGQFRVLKVLHKAHPNQGEHEVALNSWVGLPSSGYVRSDSLHSKYEVIMPYIQGNNLTAAAAKTPYALFKMMYGACTAIHNLHARNQLHRDIKDANLIYDPTDPNPSTAVHAIDFGMMAAMKRGDYEGTEAVWDTSLMGTNGFIAPELYLDRIDQEKYIQYTRASDVYALGMTFAYFLDMAHNNPAYKESELRDSSARLSRMSKLYKSHKKPLAGELVSDMSSERFIAAVPDFETRQGVLSLL